MFHLNTITGSAIRSLTFPVKPRGENKRIVFPDSARQQRVITRGEGDPASCLRPIVPQKQAWDSMLIKPNVRD